MSKSNWGGLPAEIIKIIFENLGNDKRVDYRLVNKQWYFASISVIYKSIVIQKSLANNPNNSSKLRSFCSMLQNPSYNIGRNVKEISFYSTTKYFLILDLILKHCPNVKVFINGSTTDICNHIVSVMNNSENTAICGKMQKIYTTTWTIPSHDIYRFLYVFCNSLEELDVPTIPEFSIEDEDRNGVRNEEDLYAYIKEFERLKSLCIGDNTIKSTFDCEKILQHCTLDKLSLHFRLRNNLITGPLSQDQLQIANSYETYPSLKELKISGYAPQDAMVEFMYMKNKFVILEKLYIQGTKNHPWGPLSECYQHHRIIYIQYS